nr:unconventional myosin-XVI-like [Oncorhynchus nerka]
MRKVPPPKPKRNPNTKLTGSYEEINAAGFNLLQLRPADVKLALLSRTGGLGGMGCLRGLIQRAASVDDPQGATLSLHHNQDEEDVYIEMVGAQGRSYSRGGSYQDPPDSPEQGDTEAVYEEMKYFLPEEAGLPLGGAVAAAKAAGKLEALGLMLGGLGLGLSPSQSGEGKRAGLGGVFTTMEAQTSAAGGNSKPPHSKEGGCDIPAPFPNLLTHRPPLLVFPPSPVTCSPASDESPLTPLEVKKLPVFESNLNYAGPDSPLSPQYYRQRADSSPSLSVLLPDKPNPPLTPPPPPPSANALPPPLSPPPPTFPSPQSPAYSPLPGLLLSRVGAAWTLPSPPTPPRLIGLRGTSPLPTLRPSPPAQSRAVPTPAHPHPCCSTQPTGDP